MKAVNKGKEKRKSGFLVCPIFHPGKFVCLIQVWPYDGYKCGFTNNAFFFGNEILFINKEAGQSHYKRNKKVKEQKDQVSQDD